MMEVLIRDLSGRKDIAVAKPAASFEELPAAAVAIQGRCK